MRKEILEFYEKYGLGIDKLIQKREPGVTPDQVRVAAARVYRQIQNGLKLKPRLIAHRVHGVAKMIDVDKIAEWKKNNLPGKEPEKGSKDIEIFIKLKGIK